ncbi:30S ribosomal protein S17 [uncultured archaeon]|nr:30S ribosomal protein S17 [uncultured archaeon]
MAEAKKPKGAEENMDKGSSEGHTSGQGKFSVRGGIMTGIVTSAKAPLTVTVQREIIRYVPKFERYKKDKAVVKAHNPREINAQEGDLVKVGETRKISKTKSFVVLEIVKRGEQK